MTPVSNNYNASFTIIIAITASIDMFYKSLASLNGQNVNIIAFRTKQADIVDLPSQANCLFLEESYPTIYAGYNAALQHIQTKYVQFWKAGDFVTKNAFSMLSQSLQGSDLSSGISIIAFRQVYASSNPELKSCDNYLVGLNEEPQKVPVTFYNIIFKYDLIKSLFFSEDMAYDSEVLFLWKALCADMHILIYGNATFVDSGENALRFSSFSPAQDFAWYLNTLERYRKFLYEARQKNGCIHTFIQYGAFFALKNRYDHNINTRDKHLCANHLDQLWTLSHEILNYIDDSIILNVGKYKLYRSSNSLKIWFMNLKYNNQIPLQYCTEAATGQVYLSYNGILFEKFSAQKIVLDVINREKDCFMLEFSFMELLPRVDYSLKAVYADKELEIIDTERFSQIRYFGKTIRNKRTFYIRISLKDITAKPAALTFSAKIAGRTYALKYETSRFPARINNLNHSYWYSKPYMITLSERSQLEFIKPSFRRLVCQECKYLKNLFSKSKRMVFFRLIYWLTYPFFCKKHIWVTFDKLYKAGDNGEYFYRYARKQQDGITVKYLANKGYPDTKRLKKEGLKPLYFGSIKQRLYFLHASVIAATHANIPVFSGIRPLGFSYVQDLFKGQVVCIQHGLAVQQLAHNLNAQYDNTRKFYCASPYEIKNLEQKEYGYYNKKDLELVGVCRYDGLINQDIKQILIIPTWRSYISMPVSIGNTRPYSEDFKNTTYFKVFNSLIRNKELAETARKSGYKIVYLLHPTISSQLEDYDPIEGIEVQSPVGVNYEKILTESSLMVTDYSGVQFDFAYMRKPVIYYHTPLLPPHYEEGGFFYDSMGFGEICENETQLVGLLQEYIRNNCQMKPFYMQRADDFFAYNDHENSKRVYQAIKKFDEEQLSCVH